MKVYNLICLFISPFILNGQSVVDSLLDIATSAQQDTTRILLLVKAGEMMRYNDPDRSDSVNLVALDLSEYLNYVKGVDFALSNLSSSAIVRGEYEKADQYIDALLSLAEKENLVDAKIKGFNRRAIIQYYRGDYQNAITTNLEVLAMNEESGTKRNRLNANNNIGINFERLGEYEKALEYYSNALAIARELDLEYHQAAISANIGVIHKNEGDYDQAKQYFLNSIEVAERINNQSLLVDELSNLTEVYILERDYSNAELTNERAFLVAKTLGDQNGLLKGHSQRGKIHYYRKSYTDAIRSLDSALAIANEINDEEELISIYDFLHKSHHAVRNNGKAYEYLTLFSAQKDTIYNIEKTNELNRIETLYRVAQKDNEIISQELKLERSRQEKNLLIAGAIFFGLLGMLVIYFSRKIIVGNRKLALQTQELQQQKIDYLERENKILALDAMVMGQEEERKRIAIDLHDSLGSLMATVKGHFSAIQNEMDKISNLNIYKRTDKLIDKACDEVRRISHNMMPKALTEYGLIAAIDDLVHDVRESVQFEIDFIYRGFDKRLNENTEIMVFRIVQELLQNIIKHAGASEALIQLNRQEDVIHLTVEDNGRGFDESNHSRGIGLDSVKSRVEYLSGELHIDSVISEGTTVVINIPDHAK